MKIVRTFLKNAHWGETPLDSELSSTHYVDQELTVTIKNIKSSI
jgi:hypothetical protein